MRIENHVFYFLLKVARNHGRNKRLVYATRKREGEKLTMSKKKIKTKGRRICGGIAPYIYFCRNFFLSVFVVPHVKIIIVNERKKRSVEHYSHCILFPDLFKKQHGCMKTRVAGFKCVQGSCNHRNTAKTLWLIVSDTFKTCKMSMCTWQREKNYRSSVCTCEKLSFKDVLCFSYFFLVRTERNFPFFVLTP